MAEAAEPPVPVPGNGLDQTGPDIFDTLAVNLSSMADEAREYGKAVREYLRAHSLAASTFNLAETDRLRRMAAARAVGLDPVHFDIPFPGAISNKTEEHHYHTPTAPSTNGGFGLLGKLLLGGVIGMGGAGLGVGGMLLGGLLSKPAIQGQQVQPEQKDIATQIFEKGPDGQWKKVTP